MNKRNLDILWSVSLAVTGFATFCLLGSALFDFDLSDGMKRFLGVLDLIALPALGYAMVRKIEKNYQ